MNTESPQESAVAASPPRRRSVWFPVTLAAMGLAFVFVVIQRHQIRAWWYIRQLDRTTGAERFDVFNHISAELAASDRTLMSATRNESPEVRILSAALVAQLDEDRAIPTLERLMQDDDRDVRDTAALMLAFDKRESAWECLRRSTESADEKTAATAVGVINRSTRDKVPCVLVRALQEHESGLVRAQAAEGLIVMLASLSPSAKVNGEEAQASRQGGIDNCGQCGAYRALAAALSDKGTFQGRLAYERELEEVMSQATQQGIPVSGSAPSVSTGDRRSIGEFTRRTLADSLRMPIEKLSADVDDVAQSIREVVEGRGASGAGDAAEH